MKQSPMISILPTCNVVKAVTMQSKLYNPVADPVTSERGTHGLYATTSGGHLLYDYFLRVGGGGGA